jgi:hypothetical protein
VSTDQLRKAAALMRSRARAADALGQIAETITTSTCGEFAEHIASWHPAVALAVADWLDGEAERMETAWLLAGISTSENRRAQPALAVARAYLGADQ